MPTVDLPRLAAVASAAADAARAEILPRFRNVAVEIKGDGSPVTEADRAAERAIRGVLREADGEIGILGEEYGAEGSQEGLSWLVDPIDGTLNFSRGIPLFGTLIALLEDGEPILGLIDLPGLDERTVGFRGGGVRRNGTPVRVSCRETVTDAIIAHGDAFCFDLWNERSAYDRMAAELPYFRGYSDCFGHAQVIAGGVDAMVDLALKPWDAAAARILVSEAGGRCVTLEDPSLDYSLGLVIGSPALVEQLLPYLSARARG